MRSLGGLGNSEGQPKEGGYSKLTNHRRMQKSQKIIDFSGMQFDANRRPSWRLRQKSRTMRSRNHVARNVRTIVQNIFGM